MTSPNEEVFNFVMPCLKGIFLIEFGACESHLSVAVILDASSNFDNQQSMLKKDNILIDDKSD